MTKLRDISVRPQDDNLDLVAERLKAITAQSKSINTSSPKLRAVREVINARRTALRSVERALHSRAGDSPSLFISYSGLGAPMAERAKAMAKEYGFEVKTGFDVEVEIGLRAGGEEAGGDQSLPQAIIAQIVSSTCFLGIWTDDFLDAANRPGKDGRGNSLERSTGSIPSVWMPFELGIAASRDLAFRLLVFEGTHRLYYEKPFSFKTQIVFNASNYDLKLRSVMEYFSGRVQSRIDAGFYLSP